MEAYMELFAKKSCLQDLLIFFYYYKNWYLICYDTVGTSEFLYSYVAMPNLFSLRVNFMEKI